MKPYSNYNNGFDDGVLIRDILIDSQRPSRIFWVGNNANRVKNEAGANDTNKGSYLQPWATIDGNMNSTTVRVYPGDTIYVRPGYAQTISTANGINLSVAGVKIICLGNGNGRPTITFSNTAATIAIGANNVSFENILVTNSVASVVKAFNITGNDCYLDYTSQDASHTSEFVNVVTNTGNRLSLRGHHQGFTNGSACTSHISLNGVVTGIIDVDFYGIASTAVVNFVTTACSNIKVDGIFNNGTTALIKNVVDTITGSTWIAAGYDTVGGYSFKGGSGLALSSNPSNTVALGTNGTTVMDSATTVLGAIGANNSANAFSSASVAINRPTGSVLEREAYIMSQGSQSLISVNKTLPQTVASPGTVAVTITGGPIMVEYLSLEITTVVQTQACNLSFACTDTASSTTTAFTGTAAISAAAAGAFITMNPITITTAPIVGTAGLPMTYPAAQASTSNVSLEQGMIIPAGTIGIITSASNTGNYKLHIRYRPLAPNVVVTLA